MTFLGDSREDSEMILIGEDISFCLDAFEDFRPCSRFVVLVVPEVPLSRPCGVPEFVAVDSDAVKEV